MKDPKPYRRSWIEQLAYDSQQTAFALMRERQTRQRAEDAQRATATREIPHRSADHIAADARRASAFPCPR